MLNYVHVDFERHAADLHSQVLGATYHPVCCTVRSFHLDESVGIDSGSKCQSDVVLDDNNLRTSVEDGRDLCATIKKDVDLLQGEAEGWRAIDGGWQKVREVVMHHGVVQRQSQVCYRHYLVLVGFHMVHLEFLSDVLADGVAGCEDVSRCGKRKLALHEVLLQLQDKLLIFGIAVVLVLSIGLRCAGGGGRSWGCWRGCQ